MHRLKNADGTLMNTKHVIDVLEKIKVYIEEMEVYLDSGSGDSRRFKNIWNDGDTPKFYDDICNIINSNKRK